MQDLGLKQMGPHTPMCHPAPYLVLQEESPVHDLLCHQGWVLGRGHDELPLARQRLCGGRWGPWCLAAPWSWEGTCGTAVTCEGQKKNASKGDSVPKPSGGEQGACARAGLDGAQPYPSQEAVPLAGPPPAACCPGRTRPR